MNRLALVFLALGFLSGTTAAAAPRPKSDKDDLAKFAGSWVFASWKHAGVVLDDESRATAKWSVKGDKYKFEIDGVEEEGSIKLDPTQKMPTIDLIISEGTDKGKVQLGIYKVEKNTITFCLARPGVKDRPTDFTSTMDNKNILVTIQREKKDD